MQEFTCKDCQNRHPGCHDHCEKYQTEKRTMKRASLPRERPKPFKGTLISSMPTVCAALRKKTAAPAATDNPQPLSRVAQYAASHATK